MQPRSLRPLQTLKTSVTRHSVSISRPLHTTTSRLAAAAAAAAASPNMTTASFQYIDRASFDPKATAPFEKPWSKVDGPGYSFRMAKHQRDVENIRGQESNFSTDISGFAVYNYPAKERVFRDEQAIRTGYYAEVEDVLRKKLPGVKKVVIFDHTVRRRDKNSPRQPVQQVHVDQTPKAAEIRVRRHVPESEAEDLLKLRHQIINVWRPIENPASDLPLAVVDWRTTSPNDFVKVDLLYPKRQDSPNEDGDDDRGKEVLPDPDSMTSTTGYEVKGETFAVAPSDEHKFYYYKDMTPEEVMFIKCFDSKSQWYGHKGVAHCTPHTAFADPQTPVDAPGRQSIEVRCLVFYDD